MSSFDFYGAFDGKGFGFKNVVRYKEANSGSIFIYGATHYGTRLLTYLFTVVARDSSWSGTGYLGDSSCSWLSLDWLGISVLF